MERFWKKKVVASLFSKGDVSRGGLLCPLSKGLERTPKSGHSHPLASTISTSESNGVDPFRCYKKKKKKERGKNILALLSRQPCARMHLVGTRCSSGGRMRNVSFIRSDSVLTGRDISRRRDDLAKGRGVEENETNGARIHHRRTYPDQSARARSFITDKFGQDCSRYEACGPNILLIKI